MPYMPYMPLVPVCVQGVRRDRTLTPTTTMHAYASCHGQRRVLSLACQHPCDEDARFLHLHVPVNSVSVQHHEKPRTPPQVQRNGLGWCPGTAGIVLGRWR